jgi:spore germination protein PB
MTWHIYQQITIHHIRIGAVSNASVLQIGSAGSIRACAQQLNTGGFTGPVPELAAETEEVSLVRLPAPAGKELAT